MSWSALYSYKNEEKLRTWVANNRSHEQILSSVCGTLTWQGSSNVIAAANTSCALSFNLSKSNVIFCSTNATKRCIHSLFANSSNLEHVKLLTHDGIVSVYTKWSSCSKVCCETPGNFTCQAKKHDMRKTCSEREGVECDNKSHVFA